MRMAISSMAMRWTLRHERLAARRSRWARRMPLTALPAHSKVAGDVGHRHPLAEVHHEPSEGPGVPLERVSEETVLLPNGAAAPALEHVQVEDQEDGPVPDGQGAQRVGGRPREDHVAAPAFDAASPARLGLQIEADGAASVHRGPVDVTGGAEGVVQQTGGHRGLLGNRSGNPFLIPRCPACPAITVTCATRPPAARQRL